MLSAIATGQAAGHADGGGVQPGREVGFATAPLHLCCGLDESTAGRVVHIHWLADPGQNPAQQGVVVLHQQVVESMGSGAQWHRGNARRIRRGKQRICGKVHTQKLNQTTVCHPVTPNGRTVCEMSSSISARSEMLAPGSELAVVCARVRHMPAKFDSDTDGPTGSALMGDTP